MQPVKRLPAFFLFTSIATFALCAAHSGVSHADSRFTHDATPAEIARAIENNQHYRQNSWQDSESAAATPLRPVEDTANFGYVLMSEDAPTDEVVKLRQKIAQNLPESVKLVILADTPDADQVRRQYSQWISPSRLIVATDTDTSNGFWARDSFPVPVYANSKKEVSLVAAHYYRDFSSWDAIASAVQGTHLNKEDFTFVGGNILSDDAGNCFCVDSYRLFTVTVQDLMTAYGCKTVHLMKHVNGIGDVDEVLKPLSGKRMLTNTPEYQAELESLGYQVILLPNLAGTDRTYVNSLIVQDTVFMPQYDVSEDADATKVYEGLGYRVVPIQTVDLSDNMHGSIHCQTMAYPPMEPVALLNALHLHANGS